jgi:hypothetical protein
MAQVVEVPELEPWFLVHWREPDRPDVLMEFETQEEAVSALSAAFAEMVVRIDEEMDQFPITVCSALTMLEDPVLRDALAAWDAQLSDLEARTYRVMDDLFLEGTSPMLRPRRTPPPEPS